MESLLHQRNEGDLLIIKNKIDDLYIGKIFVLWQETIIFLDTFCMQREFGYRKDQLTKTDNTEDAIKRIFLYKYAGTNKINKIIPFDE